jgi:hypothetical protein
MQIHSDHTNGLTRWEYHLSDFKQTFEIRTVIQTRICNSNLICRPAPEETQKLSQGVKGALSHHVKWQADNPPSIGVNLIKINWSV